MTLEVTLPGRAARNMHPVVQREMGSKELIYTLDDGQLLSLWTVIRLLGETREIFDPTDRCEILTEAQVLLTAFVLELKPSYPDQTRAATFETGLEQRTRFDA